MDLLRVVCLFSVLVLNYASGCGLFSFQSNYKETRFQKGVYVSATAASYPQVFLEFLRYSSKRNDQNASLSLGPLIVQIEKPCDGSKLQKKFVFSRKLPDEFIHNPPQPDSDKLKIDYQLGESGIFFAKKMITIFPRLVVRRVYQFIDFLRCNKKSVQDKWFYIVYNSRLPFGFAEIRVQQMTGFLNKKKSRCPPDDSNIEALCTGKSDYSCPNMTFEKSKGISLRNVSMYIVTGSPTSGINCSYNSARFSQYMGNHYYFMGNNSQSKKMMRTIPVMTKALRISPKADQCDKKYQMQFYVNTAHLDENNLPCPTQPGVMLQKVENLEIYVRTINGNPDTDMSEAKDQFTKELDLQKMTYVKDRHYLAQYRGHGPMFGRTLEIWVEKTEPKYVTVCQGSAGPPATMTPPIQVKVTTTSAPKTTSESIIISYY